MDEPDQAASAERLREQFHRDGFVIVRNALTHEDVGILQREVDCLMNFLISENYDIMKDFGGIIEPISCGYIDPPATQMYILSKRAYSSIRNLVTEDPDTVVPLLFEKMAALAKNFLPTADTDDYPICLFNEQYIVKTPKSDATSAFAWHQDSEYMDPTAQKDFPIVSCWTALDDSNGTLIIEPFPRPTNAGSGSAFTLPSSLNDRTSLLQYHKRLAACYGKELDKDDALARALKPRSPTSAAIEESRATLSNPDDTMDPRMMFTFERQEPVLVEIPAGSIVFLSGLVRHCSMGNSSSKFRRAYMPQFSSGKVVGEEERLVSLAVPVDDTHHRS
ncbi:hypothetical protein BGZ75_004339 [Mortierella antarctica]|nr:hypothetical protein BGZ75_004339 [Mortierella antarctica]